MTTTDTSRGEEKHSSNSKGKDSRRKPFVGLTERLTVRAQERRRRNKARPWLERKFVVGLVVAFFGYSWYVYVGHFCVPMIRRHANALGNRATGIAFLVVFSIFSLMFMWTYIKLVVTPPGYARDFCEKRSPPAPGESHRGPLQSPPRFQHWDSGSDLAGPSYEDQTEPASETASPVTPPDDQRPTSLEMNLEKHGADTVAVRTPQRHPSERRHHHHRSRSSSNVSSPTRVSHSKRGDIRQVDKPPEDLKLGTANTIAPAGKLDPKLSPLPPRRPERSYESPSRNENDDLPPMRDSRRPPAHPVLAEEYRYCQKDQIIKPMRSHHCRTCGTCVLMYDHHCPWIGQCVGAGNDKFFVNFLQWVVPFVLWVFTTLLGFVARAAATRSPFSVDPQHIVVIVLSGFFTLFTIAMLATHIHLIFVNQTSVESLYVSGMRDRERDILERQVPLSIWGCHRKRNAIRAEWDQEWGKLGTEGNLYWLGSSRANWDQRMGKNKWGWFLPIGRAEGDGLIFSTNPRFDEEGRWRRRRDWPIELQ